MHGTPQHGTPQKMSTFVNSPRPQKCSNPNTVEACAGRGSRRGVWRAPHAREEFCATYAEPGRGDRYVCPPLPGVTHLLDRHLLAGMSPAEWRHCSTAAPQKASTCVNSRRPAKVLQPQYSCGVRSMGLAQGSLASVRTHRRPLSSVGLRHPEKVGG